MGTQRKEKLCQGAYETFLKQGMDERTGIHWASERPFIYSFTLSCAGDTVAKQPSPYSRGVHSLVTG